MELFLNIVKSVIFGIVQGITEWLPISSTGHLILLENFMPLNVYADEASNQAFWDMYKVVIQFGSILAVILMYWQSLWPFSKKLTEKKRKRIWRLWLLIIIASVPAGIAGLLLNDWIDNVMSASWVIAVALIVYGILFIWMEKREHHYEVMRIADITPKKALGVGAFQMLALIPGTSRSGSTILGATLLGFDRPTAAKFSFYMAIPVMFGASLLKMVKADITYTGAGIAVLLVGMITAFIVSVIVIRRLMQYIRKHDFTAFGIYRIILGIVVLICSLAGILH